MLRGWWAKTSRPTDPRSFSERPIASVLLEFYRTQAERLRQLDAITEHRPLDQAENAEHDALKETLGPDKPAPSLLSLIESKPSATYGADTVFDSWVQATKTGNIPDDWWGPHKERLLAKKKQADDEKRAKEAKPPTRSKMT